MAEPGLSAAAEIVRRLDPPLFLAALFAPEPARERLLVLGAFDIELSRAVRRGLGTAEGPLLARMRLQFWRDRLAAAERSEEPGPEVAAHEVAGPFHDLLAGPLAAAAADAGALIEAREAELAAPFDDAAWQHWAQMRFAAWHRLALSALGLGAGSATALAASAAGTLAAVGFTLRHAAPLAADGMTLLPGLADGDTGRIVRGEPSHTVDASKGRLILLGIDARAELRSLRGAVGRRATPAFLPLVRAERTVRRAVSGDALPDLAAGGDGRHLAIPYAWRAVSGRW